MPSDSGQARSCERDGHGIARRRERVEQQEARCPLTPADEPVREMIVSAEEPRCAVQLARQSRTSCRRSE
jgi:hypothetical protein